MCQDEGALEREEQVDIPKSLIFAYKNMIKEESKIKTKLSEMDLNKLSKPPKRRSKVSAHSFLLQKPDELPGAQGLQLGYLPHQINKQNKMGVSKSKRHSFLDIVPQMSSRDRSRQNFNISLVTSNRKVRDKSQSRWQKPNYLTTPYKQKPISNCYRAKSPILSPYKKDFASDSKKHKENLQSNSFLEGINYAKKKSQIDKKNPSSYFHRQSAYINPDNSYSSRGKFGRSPLQLRQSTREQAPYLNQTKFMHETYTHPPSIYKNSQTSYKNNFMPEKVQQKSSIFCQPKLRDFMIGEIKGEGRFGKVYVAIHKKTGFLCGLKKIKKDSVRVMLDQFIQELKIQLFLNHSKLVKMYGYFSDEEHFYMLIEYMEEGSLYSLMKKAKKFEQPDAVEKINEICIGIKELHDNNIMHRDLKPQNIVMSYGVCKVCDFGWAAICKEYEGRRQTYCGTLDYVCPQILEGISYDMTVDIWCIGVLAYEMLSGKAPFYDISRKKTMQKIVDCKIESFPSNFSWKAVNFIQKALQKNPDQRVGIQELLSSEFLKGANKGI